MGFSSIGGKLPVRDNMLFRSGVVVVGFFVAPFSTYMFCRLRPRKTILPSFRITISPPREANSQPFASKQPKEIRFFFRVGTYLTSLRVTSSLASSRRIVTEPTPIALHHVSSPRRMFSLSVGWKSTKASLLEVMW